MPHILHILPSSDLSQELQLSIHKFGMNLQDTILITNTPIEFFLLNTDLKNYTPLRYRPRYNDPGFILQNLTKISSLRPDLHSSNIVNYSHDILKLIQYFESHNIPLNTITELDILSYSNHYSRSIPLLINIWRDIQHIISDDIQKHFLRISNRLKSYKNILLLNPIITDPHVQSLIYSLKDHPSLYVFLYTAKMYNALSSSYAHNNTLLLYETLGLPVTYSNEYPSEQDVLIHNLFPTEESIKKWPSTNKISVNNISLIENHSLYQEASWIVETIRKHQNKSIAIISGDNNLNKLLTSILSSTSINYNNYITQPNASLSHNSLIHNILQFTKEPTNFSYLFNILQHQLVNLSFSQQEFSEKLQIFENQVLRTTHNCADILSLQEYSVKKSPALRIFFNRLLNALDPVLSLSIKNSLSVSHISSALLSSAILFAHDPAPFHDMKEQICKYDLLVQSLEQYSHILKYILSLALSPEAPSTKYNISLISPDNAINLHADISIIASFNHDNWLDNAFPETIILPKSVSNKIPIIHNSIKNIHTNILLQHLYKKSVYLTRTICFQGRLLQPPIYLRYIKNLLKHDILLSCDTPLSHIQHLYPYTPPIIKPLSHNVPKRISASSIEKLMRNPYAFYLNNICNIRELQSVEYRPDHKDFGTILHSIMNEYNKSYNLNIRPLQQFKNITNKLLRQYSNYPIMKLWALKIYNMADKIIEEDLIRRDNATNIITEKECLDAIHSLNMTIYSVCDRIEILQDNTLAIIDIKTGSLPTYKDISYGFSPQLLIQAITAEKTFGLPVSQIAYWKIKNSDISIKNIKNPESLILDAKIGIEKLLSAFFQDNTPYYSHPCPDKSPAYNQFTQIERTEEWL